MPIRVRIDPRVGQRFREACDDIGPSRRSIQGEDVRVSGA
jgi:hypothetical protein